MNAKEILRKHTGLTVTDPAAFRMQCEIIYVINAMEEYKDQELSALSEKYDKLQSEYLKTQETGWDE